MCDSGESCGETYLDGIISNIGSVARKLIQNNGQLTEEQRQKLEELLKFLRTCLQAGK